MFRGPIFLHNTLIFMLLSLISVVLGTSFPIKTFRLLWESGGASFPGRQGSSPRGGRKMRLQTVPAAKSAQIRHEIPLRPIYLSRTLASAQVIRLTPSLSKRAPPPPPLRPGVIVLRIGLQVAEKKVAHARQRQDAPGGRNKCLMVWPSCICKELAKFRTPLSPTHSHTLSHSRKHNAPLFLLLFYF